MFIQRILTGILLIAVGITAGCGGGGSSDPAEPRDPLRNGERDPVRMEIMSDRSFILTDAGDTAELRAGVVLDDGSIDRSAEIQFTSSNPDLIEVDATGRIRALSDEIGSANIVLEYGDLAPVHALVAIANLAPETLKVENDWLIDDQLVDPDQEIARVVLVRNAQTEALQPGDILISDDKLGLLDEIIAAEVRDDRVVLQTRPASLVDAFQDLLIDSKGPPLESSGVLDEDAHVDDQGNIIEPATAIPGQRLEPAALFEIEVGPFTCEFDGSMSDLNLSGYSLAHRINLVPGVIIQIENYSLRQFDMFVDGEVGVEAAVGQVELTGLSASVDCKREFADIPFVGVPIVGPLLVDKSLEPAIGMEIEAGYTGSLELEGPRADVGQQVRLGIGYEYYEGFRTLNSSRDIGDGVTWPSDWMRVSDSEFSVKATPYLGGTVKGNLRVLRWALVDAKLIGAKVGAGGELKIAPPVDFAAAGYTGPRLQFFGKATAGLDPLVDNLDPVKKFFTRVGVPRAEGLADFVGLNLKLFDWTPQLWASPEPLLQVAPASVEVEETLSMQVVRGGSNRDVEFVAIRQDVSPGSAVSRMNVPWSYKVLAQSTTDSDGTAQATWEPEVDEAGTYEINVRLAGLFSAEGFPYAAKAPSYVDVSGDVALSINPSGISNGEVDVVYDFDLHARRIPPGIEEVTFEYTWGDGSAGSASATVDQNSEARATISHAYSDEGAYGIVVTLAGLATRNALVTIGDVREREVELNICGVWRAAQQGGQGVTVDNWDIRDIPLGAVFDMGFDAYTIPDKYIVEYPVGAVVLDTGWRGASYYEGNPLYPGGIAGPGRGQVDGFFTRSGVDEFKVTVIGPQSGTRWRYQIRCRVED